MDNGEVADGDRHRYAYGTNNNRNIPNHHSHLREDAAGNDAVPDGTKDKHGRWESLLGGRH